MEKPRKILPGEIKEADIDKAFREAFPDRAEEMDKGIGGELLLSFLLKLSESEGVGKG